MSPGNIFDHVLELHQVIGRRSQAVKCVVDLALAGCSYFMVGTLDFEPDLLQLSHHVIPDVSEVINGGNGEVTTLVTGFIAAVATFFHATGIPGTFHRVDEVVPGMLICFKPDVIKNVKFGFGSKIDRVSDAG